MRLENKPQRTKRVLSSHFLNFSVTFVWKLYITNYGRNLSKIDKDKTKHLNQTWRKKAWFHIKVDNALIKMFNIGRK